MTAASFDNIKRSFKMFKAHPLLILCFFSTQAFSSVVESRVAQIWGAQNSNYMMFSLIGNVAEKHRCNTSDRYSIDMSKPGGTRLTDLILLSKKEDYTIVVKTLNTCNPFDAENVREIVIQ